MDQVSIQLLMMAIIIHLCKASGKNMEHYDAILFIMDCRIEFIIIIEILGL